MIETVRQQSTVAFTPEVGDVIRGDLWVVGRELLPGFAGAGFTYYAAGDRAHQVAVDVRITGRTRRRDAGQTAVRCRIRVWDEEAGWVTFRGWLYPKPRVAR